MKYLQKHYLLKLPACTLEGATNNANQCWVLHITPPYKFVSPWSFMYIMAGSLQVNAFTKPTLHAILQTKFQYIGALKMHCILITQLLSVYDKTLKCIKFKNVYTPAPFPNDEWMLQKQTDCVWNKK